MNNKVQKKTNCKNCGFYDGTYCRVGLGWNKPKEYCENIWRIGDKRCGTCEHFSIADGDRRSGHCDLLDDFRNFYNYCNDSCYVKEEGKDLRPDPDMRINRIRVDFDTKSPLLIINDE